MFRASEFGYAYPRTASQVLKTAEQQWIVKGLAEFQTNVSHMR
jgi:hypothetical protein